MFLSGSRRKLTTLFDDLCIGNQAVYLLFKVLRQYMDYALQTCVIF